VLGHADPGFTLRTYIHSTETEDDRAFRALDTLFETRSAG